MNPIQHCEVCKRLFSVLNLFRGKWVCYWCYQRLASKRDSEYYENLRKWSLKQLKGKKHGKA